MGVVDITLNFAILSEAALGELKIWVKYLLFPYLSKIFRIAFFVWLNNIIILIELLFYRVPIISFSPATFITHRKELVLTTKFRLFYSDTKRPTTNYNSALYS